MTQGGTLLRQPRDQHVGAGGARGGGHPVVAGRRQHITIIRVASWGLGPHRRPTRTWPADLACRNDRPLRHVRRGSSSSWHESPAIALEHFSLWHHLDVRLTSLIVRLRTMEGCTSAHPQAFVLSTCGHPSSLADAASYFDCWVTPLTTRPYWPHSDRLCWWSSQKATGCCSQSQDSCAATIVRRRLRARASADSTALREIPNSAAIWP